MSFQQLSKTIPTISTISILFIRLSALPLQFQDVLTGALHAIGRMPHGELACRLSLSLLRPASLTCSGPPARLGGTIRSARVASQAQDPDTGMDSAGRAEFAEKAGHPCPTAFIALCGHSKNGPIWPAMGRQGNVWYGVEGEAWAWR